MHLDADTISSVNPGDPLGQWDDLYSVSHHATALSSSRPIYLTGALNGYTVVRFDGIADWMDIGSIRNAPGVHAFVVSQRSDTSGQKWQRLVSTWDGASLDDYQGQGWNIMRPYTNGTPIAYEATMFQRYASSGVEIDNIKLGRSSTWYGHFLAGDIAEVLIYDRRLDTSKQVAK